MLPDFLVNILERIFVLKTRRIGQPRGALKFLKEKEGQSPIMRVFLHFKQQKTRQWALWTQELNPIVSMPTLGPLMERIGLYNKAYQKTNFFENNFVTLK